MSAIFDAERMRKFAEEDKLIQFMIKNLGDDDETLEAIFNSEILDDTAMEIIYNKVKVK
ncbi:MAG TPA: hypothetical protein VNM69_13105 [Bacillus sp. (in: firmicutes)]|uniref:hypothetical protein n=1 Tax=Bacillus litorisediminis TaxID=2922713 RepID=UPI001FAF74DF|nr:hypothetical protein [Bacillus litorisediminis]HWO76809.1 hypothetical protein [Bacillus sp. (in: firmicutes)]